MQSASVSENLCIAITMVNNSPLPTVRSGRLSKLVFQNSWDLGVYFIMRALSRQYCFFMFSNNAFFNSENTVKNHFQPLRFNWGSPTLQFLPGSC